MTLVIPFTCVIQPDGRRKKHQWPILAQVRRPHHTESNPQVENACQIHQALECGLRRQHTLSRDNCWPWPEYKGSDALVDIRLLHRVCHAPLLHFAASKFFIFPYTRTDRVLRCSQHPLSILILFIYPRHLSFIFIFPFIILRCVIPVVCLNYKVR